jgi:hypothetical protein
MISLIRFSLTLHVRYYNTLTKKGDVKLLRALLENEVSPNIHWREIESLFLKLGGTIEPGSGSKVKMMLDGCIMNIHKPHGVSGIEAGRLKSISSFLRKEVGVILPEK